MKESVYDGKKAKAVYRKFKKTIVDLYNSVGVWHFKINNHRMD